MSNRMIYPPARSLDDVEAEFEEILYHITHDLRASTRAIRLVPRWLREDLCALMPELPHSIDEGLEQLCVHAERMDRMLRDLRTFSRVGRRFDTPGRISLPDLLTEVVADRAPAPARVLIRLELKEVFGPLNEYRLILQELIDNAVKHHDGGTPRIWVATHRQGGNLILSVADDGPGIDVKFRARVFEMLSTLRSRDDVEGSGLGLSIVHKICRVHGGSISISDRADGRGCCFTVQLPLRSGAANINSSGPRLAQI